MTKHRSVPTAKAVAVFVADSTQFDCELVIKSLAHRHLRVVGWATSSHDVVEQIQQRRPDVAVISARLQDGALAGIRAVSQLQHVNSRTRIIVLLDAKDPNLVVEVFRNGGAGVLYRSGGSSPLIKCIRRVNAGQLWASHEDAIFFIEALRATPQARICNAKGVPLLTNREEDVVRLVSGGFTNREIAKELGLSEHTVKNYMFDVFEKLGVSRRVELVLRARDHEGMVHSLGPTVVAN